MWETFTGLSSKDFENTIPSVSVPNEIYVRGEEIQALDQEMFMQTSFYCMFGLVVKLFMGTIYLTSASVSGFCFTNSSKINHVVCSIIYALKWKATNYK